MLKLMVVLYGFMLLCALYLTYLTYKDRVKSAEIKRQNIVNKGLLKEINTLKSQIHGKKSKRVEAQEA